MIVTYLIVCNKQIRGVGANSPSICRVSVICCRIDDLAETGRSHMQFSLSVVVYGPLEAFRSATVARWQRLIATLLSDVRRISKDDGIRFAHDELVSV